MLAAIGNKTVNEGQSLTFTISATDPDGDNLTYSASNLPSGATFTPATRTFSWTPSYTQAGTYANVHFQVSDGSLTDSENITILVIDNTPPRITNVSTINIDQRSADINWTTNELSTSQVEYWASPAKLTGLDGNMVTNHVVHLSKLSPGITYSYRIISIDKAGNKAVLNGGTFTTYKIIFSVSVLKIQPTKVTSGEKVIISVLVTNTGNVSGNYTVTLKINGLTEATKIVTLGAMASQKITFATTKNASGIYSVDVNGLTGSFEVVRLRSRQ